MFTFAIQNPARLETYLKVRLSEGSWASNGSGGVVTPGNPERKVFFSMSRLMKEKVDNLYRILTNKDLGPMLVFWAELFDQYKESSLHENSLEPQSLDELRQSILKSARNVSRSIETLCESMLGYPVRGLFEMLAGWEDEEGVPFSDKPIAESFGEPTHYKQA